MTFVLDAALRTSAPVALALLGCVLLRRRSAALRHRVLTAGLAGAIAVVPLSVILPSWNVALPSAARAIHRPAADPVRADMAVAAPAQGQAAAAPAASTARIRSADAAFVVFLVWIAGATTGGGLLLIGLIRLFRLTRRAEPVLDGPWRRLSAEIAARYGIRRPIAVLRTDAADVLATWGLFRPRVLLPAQAGGWSEDRAQAALCHELAHVARHDWTIQVAADLLRIAFWFNPLLWMLCASIRRESEHACDDAVLGVGVPAGAYAQHLVAIAKACRRRASTRVPALPVARPSTLEGRIAAMLNSHLDRRAPAWGATALILAALVGIGIPAASLGLSAQGIGPGALTGYIYDSSGGVLPGVEVTLFSAARRERRSAVSDGTGRFRFPGVGAGEYVLEATLPGFRAFRNELALDTPRDWTRNITMQVGELEETVTVRAKRPAEAVPLQQAAGRGNPVRVGGNIKAPVKIKNVAPVYPAAMQQAGLEGIVPMDALIGTDGRVVSVRVLSADVHPAFARAAEEAVRQWVFSPTFLNNVPVEVEMTVSVAFALEE